MGLFGFFRKKKQEEKTPAERRLVPRWNICAPAKMKWLGRDDYEECEIRDLNMKGLCVVLKEKIPEGSSGAQLYFNEQFFFDIEFVVAWYKESGGRHNYGLKFTRLRDADKERIFHMMKQNFPSQFANNL